jgi:hypothetical protein
MEQPSEEIHIAVGDLLIFVDDTGHESFGSQRYFGLGGCAVLAEHYGRLKGLWMDVRTRIKGHPDARLHASDKSIRADANFKILADFFSDRSFLLFAVMSMESVILPGKMHPATPVTGAIQEDIAILGNLLPCNTVSLILESSQRADPILKQCFSELGPGSIQLAKPLNHYLMPKSGGEPGLEIADFIINAAGSQIRRHLRGEQGPAPDFFDVFCRLPPEGCLFSIIGAVADDAQNQAVQMLRFRLGVIPDFGPASP